MEKEAILEELMFEKECSLEIALYIYQVYKQKNQIELLLEKLKHHKEV